MAITSRVEVLVFKTNYGSNSNNNMDFQESLFNYDCANVRVVFDLRDLRFGIRIYCCT